MVKLEDYTIGELKKMISSFNKLVKFSGYSKLPKAKLITMIRTHPKINVEEGANAVKLSIKTDENFEKQTKVKKEKVKKEVKKEVEKLDDVKVVVKPVAKAENPLTTEEKNEVESLVDYMDKGFKIKGSDFSSSKNLKEIITKLKFSRDKLKRNGKLEKALERFEKGKAKTEPKKEEPKKKLKFNIKKKEEEPKQLFNKEEKELNEKTLNMILKADVVILLKPADVALDPKLRKKIQRLYNKLFKVYQKSYGDLLDKYNISKSNYRQKAIRIFGGLIKEARKEKEK